jgi:hypothetical protein
MKKTFLIIAFTLMVASFQLVRAQDQPGTVRFPTNLDSPDSLFRVKNNSHSNLSASIMTGSTTLTVADASSFPASGALSIDSEIIYYTTKTSNTFSGLTRGASSTTAAAHTVGVLVRSPIIAAYHETLVNALIAVETKLGNGATIDPLKIGAGTVNSTKWGYLANLSSDVQTALDLKANTSSVQAVSYNTCSDAGANDSYGCSLSPAIVSYTTGQVTWFKAATANTGAATLNLNGLGAKTIKKQKDTDLADNDIKAGQWVAVQYDGTNFQMLSPVSNAGGIAGLSSYTSDGIRPFVLNPISKNLFSGNSASGNVDLYTVPSGKRFIVYTALGWNANASLTVTWKMQAKIGGTYYPLMAAVSAGAQGNSTQGNLGYYVFEAGEIVSANTTNIGLNIWIRGVEFDDTSSLRSYKLTAFASGDNTLYTVPVGKTAQILSSTPTSLTVPGGILLINTSGSTITTTYHAVPSGGTKGLSNEFTPAAGTSVVAGALSAPNAPPVLNAGDVIILNSSAVVAGGWAWLSVVEY